MTHDAASADKKKNRGWWNRTRDSNGEIVELEPTEEAMKPDAPHWKLMLETLKSLRQQALETQMQGGQIPSWAFAEKKSQQGGAKELAGPIVASQVQLLVSVPVVSSWEIDSVCVYICMYACMYVCMRACVRALACTCVCLCICFHVCVFIHEFVYACQRKFTFMFFCPCRCA